MVTVVVTDGGIERQGQAERGAGCGRYRRPTLMSRITEEDAVANPVVTLSTLAPKVGVPLTATLDDPDGGEKDIEWKWRIDRC